MKILEILVSESVREERQTQQRNAQVLKHLYDERRAIKRELNDALVTADEDEINELEQQLTDIDNNIRELEGWVSEAKNHLGDREYQTHSSWKAACKKAYPGCTFRGDKDIGAAVLNGHDVGEWDGAVGSVYNKVVNETADQTIAHLMDDIKRDEAKLKEMESDLRLMDNAARSEKEMDAVYDFRKEVEKQRRVVERLKKSLKLHRAAKTSGVMESRS